MKHNCKAIVYCRMCDEHHCLTDVEVKRLFVTPQFQVSSTATFKCPDCKSITTSNITEAKYKYSNQFA